MAIRKIDIDDDASFYIRALDYGDSGTGKTHFAAQFPRPLFLSEDSEGGWKTIKSMDRSLFYDEGVKPEIWLIDGPMEMAEAVGEAESAFAKDPRRWGTVVTDSFSLYADATIAQYSKTMKDGRQLYGGLALHVTEILRRIHRLPCHQLHLCLAKDPEGPETDKNGHVIKPATLGWPLIPGQSAKKVPARMDAWLFHRVQRGPNGLEFEIRTKTWGQYHCRHRFGADFPDPLPEPTFAALEAAVGLTPRHRTAAAPARPPLRAVAVPHRPLPPPPPHRVG